MRHWLINANSRSVEADLKTASFTLLTRRRPSLDVGDRVLFLENHPAVFGHSAVIESVDSPEESTRAASAVVSLDRKPTTYRLSELKEIGYALSLEEARFSLTIVRNTATPWVHFRRAYRLLPATDFESVEQRQTFVTRTGYFELLNSLPKSLELTFRSEQILLPEPESYRERLSRLHEFLDRRVFAAGRMLRSIKHATDTLNLLGEDGRPLSHLFSPEPDDAVRSLTHADDLDAQLHRFSKLEGLLETTQEVDGQESPADTITRILAELKDDKINRSEVRFERVFRRLR